MKIALIGFGAIAQYVKPRVERSGHEIGAIIVTQDFLRRTRTDAHDGIEFVTSFDHISETIDLFVDCAGHSGLKEHGPEILGAGHALLSISIGAFADPDLKDMLEKAAIDGGGKIILASGAIGGLDALRAARVGGLTSVRYIGRKPPEGWVGSPAEEVLDLQNLGKDAQTHFQGSARDAALLYPKNANVAAAVALSGIGFDDTEVELIADPKVPQNVHIVQAEGDFGNFEFKISGKPVAANPRTSALAAMSAVSGILQFAERTKF